jgi:hypothetical protein
MLTRDLLKKIRKIEIVTERLVRDRMAGQYHSVFKGSGIAFSEVRQYMPGDDIRLIDWNVSARMNDTYVKLFTEEREMTVLLLVDMSASGRFGSRVQEKRELGAEIAAVLAFSAIRNNDRPRRAKSTSCASSARSWPSSRAAGARTWRARCSSWGASRAGAPSPSSSRTSSRPQHSTSARCASRRGGTTSCP